MALTDVFTKFLKKPPKEDANFLSLTLTVDRVLATIWALDGERVETLGFSKKSFQNINSIVHQAAVAIDTAAEKAKTDVSEAVFGLSANWFDEGKLKKESTKTLKKLSVDLDLSSQAFVSIASSIKNKIKIDEGVTPQLIVLGIFDEFAESSLVKNNEVVTTKTVNAKITTDKIVSLIKQLGDDKTLPSRIVVYGISEESKVAQDLIRAKWEGTFLSLPKIEFLKDGEVSKSVAYAQAADVLGHEPVLLPSGAQPEEAPEENPQRDEIAGANEFGFIEGEDILKPQTQEEDLDNLQEPEVEIREPLHQPIHEQTAVTTEQTGQMEEESRQHQKRQGEKGLVESITTLSWLPNLPDIFKGPGASKKLAIGLGALVVAVVLTMLIAGKALTSAEVVILVNSKTQDDTFDVDVTRGSSTNFDKQQIAGQVVTGSASGSRKEIATGKKEVGQNAKGPVTVFNWTTSKKSLPTNTVLISKNGIKFALDSEIEVASRSASTPGETQTAVTAVEFGPEGNVGAGTDFNFQQYDELLYSATSTAAFSGGDKKEVTVVSQQDLLKLEKSLTESLKQNATGDLKNNLGGGQMDEGAVVVKAQNKTFDKKVDEEASLINLDLELEASTISYNVDDLKNLLAEKSKNSAPDNLEAKAENIEIIETNAKNTGNVLNLTGKYKAGFVPKFDEDQLKNNIGGKSVKDVRQIIKGLPEVSDVKVNFSPAFLFASAIPKDPKKVKFKFETI